MSDALYPNRLRWNGTSGVARRIGRDPVALLLPPHLPNLEVEQLDFAPFCFGIVTPRFQGRRDMERHELEQALRLWIELTT